MPRLIGLLLALVLGSQPVVAQEASFGLSVPPPPVLTTKFQDSWRSASILEPELFFEDAPLESRPSAGMGLKSDARIGLMPYQAARNSVIEHALSLRYARYRMGGGSPDEGFDCSGFVKYVFQRAAGLELVGNAATLAKQGRSVLKTHLRSGDLVFFNTRNKPLSHVGVYLGEGEFIHAAGTGKGIQVSRLAHPYFAKRYQGARTLFH